MLLRVPYVSELDIIWNSRAMGKLNLDSVLVKGDQLFKFIVRFIYLGMEDLPQEFSIENCSINGEFSRK